MCYYSIVKEKNMCQLLEFRPFYDNYQASDVPGMFSLPHLILAVIVIATLILALYLSRNFNQKQMKILQIIVTAVVTILEIIKITIRVCKGDNYDGFIPLYFCSLFIYASWLTFAKNKFLQDCGYAYITMGGVLAGMMYIIYPSTSLTLFPWWHPSTIHSFLYHWILIYYGIMVIWKKAYTPTPKNSLNYFAFIFAFCIPSIILNKFLGTNCMFLNNAFQLPVLDNILQYSKVLYIIVAILGQAVILYWLSYGLYKLHTLIINRRRSTNERL